MTYNVIPFAEHARLQAVTCAVLAPAGQQRARILATLFKDERCQSLPIFPILRVRLPSHTSLIHQFLTGRICISIGSLDLTR